MIDEIRTKLNSLPPTSDVRNALDSGILAAAEARVAVADADELRGYWPPLVGFVDGNPISNLAALDSDLDLVRRHSRAGARGQLTSFLTAKATDKPGVWCGGLFDVATKAIAINAVPGTEVDFQLPNGRQCDIRLPLGECFIHLESTVINEDDESRQVAERAWADQGNSGSVSYTRPGKYCPEKPKGPSPYYDVLRVYGKIFDKLAPNLDLKNSQLHPHSPNVLLLSSGHACLRSDAPGLGWALDELFTTHPQFRRIIPEGFTDFTLSGWISHKSSELLTNGEMTLAQSDEREKGVFAALRRLSGILLFDGCDLKAARINYNADEDCRISHGDIATIERIYQAKPSYYSR
jgi:hypothetical protein